MMPASVYKRFTLLMTLLFALFCVNASAEIVIQTVRQEAGEDSFVTYPKLQGFSDSLVQETINAHILSEGQIQDHLNTLLVLSSGVPGKLIVTYEAALFPSAENPSVFSVLIEAEGRMPNARNGHRFTPMMLDTGTGERISWEALFENPDQAQALIEEWVFDTLEPDLSNYINIALLTPFPIDRVLITDSGLSFYYPENSLVWLSGKSASIHFLFHELREWLNLEDGSLLSRLGVPESLQIQEISAEKIAEIVSRGELPGLDAKAGDSLDNLIAEHRLLYDPDGFMSGERYQLEKDRYRGVALISNDGQTVSGILTKRINLFGLITGETRREDTQRVLGVPEAGMELDQAAAQAYGVPMGTMDVYRFKIYALRFFYGEDDVLNAVMMSIAEGT